MCKCVGDEWLYDIQDSDVERFQYYLKDLLMIFGLSQMDLMTMLGLGQATITKYVTRRYPIPRPTYAYLRMWMQCNHDNGPLQNDALYFFTHRMDEHEIVKTKRDRLRKLCSKYDKTKYMRKTEIRSRLDIDYGR